MAIGNGNVNEPLGRNTQCTECRTHAPYSVWFGVCVWLAIQFCVYRVLVLFISLIFQSVSISFSLLHPPLRQSYSISLLCSLCNELWTTASLMLMAWQRNHDTIVKLFQTHPSHPPSSQPFATICHGKIAYLLIESNKKCVFHSSRLTRFIPQTPKINPV